MIQYLINATAIWLVSLIVFDLFLRRSTLHGYNRAFLVITALLGALLPLYHTSRPVAQLSPALARPMLAVADMKQNIATVASVPHTSFPWASLIFGAYVLGVVISGCMLLREGLILFRWYRSADVQLRGDRRIVVTHRDHGPFSILGYIFISDADAYTPDELRFILQHEGVHIQRRHYLDKALMLVLRCIFWMNPLIYIYYNRLMMTHEFEADDTSRPASRDYSHFLIHQHLTGAMPLIAHSFFHSPLKNRIRMLTATRTRAWRKAAYLVALPAIAAFAILWVNNSTARKRVQQGNIVTLGENKFELGSPMMGGHAPADTVRMIVSGGAGTTGTSGSDAISLKVGEKASVVPADRPEFSIIATLDPVPVKMNGEVIYDAEHLKVAPELPGRSKSLLSYVVTNAQAEFNKLADGKYDLWISDVIVDKSGRVVYYSVSPVLWKAGTFSFEPGKDFNETQAAAKKEKEAHPIDASLSDEIHIAVERALDDLVLTPGKKDGQPVIVRASIAPGYSEAIVVLNHRARVERNK